MNKEKESIIYHDDFNCNPMVLKNHTIGLKNIYTVEVCYLVEGNGNNISIAMRYGSFPVAYRRFLKEQVSAVPYGKKRTKVKIEVTTYSDTKVVHRETMDSIDYPLRTSNATVEKGVVVC